MDEAGEGLQRKETSGPLRYLARYRAQVGAGILCLVVTNVLAQSIPWVVKWTVEAIQSAHAREKIATFAALLLGLAVGQAVIRILSRIFIFNAGRDAEYEIRRTLFHRLCQLDGTFYRKFRTGDLMSRLTNDLAAVRALFGPGVLHVVNTIFAYAVGLPLMLRIDPLLTLASLSPYLVLLVGARIFARGIYTRSQDLQVSLSSMTSTVQENLAGIRELKNHRLEARRAEVFGETSRLYLGQAVRLARWRSGFIPFVALGSGGSLVVLLWMGGAKVIGGELTLGDLVAMSLYLGLLAWPTMAIGWMISLWHRGVASWHRLLEIIGEVSPLEVDLERGDASGAKRAPAPTGAAPSPPRSEPGPGLEVRRLTLTLEGRDLLHDVSFTVEPGTLCAVVGRIGAGKTTLVEALARLVAVPRDRIFLDGTDVTRLPVSFVRGQIAYSPQSAFLFSASIRENILLGLDPEKERALPAAAREKRLQEVVHAAGLEPDLDSFPAGLESEVGERGLTISGGQRQRIALARALMADRPILLLDDSLSSVDTDTERKILEALGGIIEGRTAVLVSHRVSALRHAHKIVVLDGGEVAEAGRHEELLARGGLYATLYRQQLLLEAP